MSKLTLGLDISDERLIAVQTEQKGKVTSVVDFVSVPLYHGSDFASSLELLLQHFPDFKGSVVCGVSLQKISVRNLFLPFRDSKRLDQTLPMEMSEQLLGPAEDYLIDYLVARRTQEGSHLLVFSMSIEHLAGLFQFLNQAGLDPEVIQPSVVAYGGCCAKARPGTSCLIVHVEMHCTTVSVLQEANLLFSRRLPHPEQVLVHPPISEDEGRLVVRDIDTLNAAVELICSKVERAVDFFRIREGIPLEFADATLCGPLAERAELKEAFAQRLAMPVKSSNLLTQTGCIIGSHQKNSYIPALFDTALALALEGGQRRPEVNFRRGAFARKQSLLEMSGQLGLAAGALALILVSVLGYLLYDQRQLQSRHDRLKQQMVEMYQEAFPDDVRVFDPLAQMRSKMQEIRVPAVSLPIFTQERRVLGLLTDISARISPQMTIKVSRLVVDQEGVSIKGTTNAFNNVDTIKNQLRESGYYSEVQIVSATAEKGENLVRFEMKLQTAEII
ncbi:MAG: hypothetical protein CSA34_02815 [Desulfobulbus propionicus]|nr:MAG: hypothetical protein CSA34_02815 [Desulfobulbus propionicus]